MYYREEDRGIIQNQKNFHQKVLFEGIRYGKCMPTDIDAAMEFDNKALILYELKYGEAQVPRGQMLLLQRIIDAWQQDGRQAVLFICRHDTPSGQDIELRKAKVTDVYYNGQLIHKKKPKTAEEQTRDFLKFVDVIT